MSISHEQAQKLIQLGTDQVLNQDESAKLSAHLRDCSACTAYASEIKEVVNILHPMMKRQWNVQPVPLSISCLTGKNEKSQSSNYLTMRTAAVSLVVMALFFSAWQVMFPSSSPQSQLSPAIPPVPTPSHLTAQFVSTQLTRENCMRTLYTVQEHDTLVSIAEQFSVPVPAITELNQLEEEMVHSGMELTIPICHFTPTGTFHAATFTTTLTPVLNFRTSTPGG